ncbi:MAG TPA: LysM peptidoglycan-binding domain-containing protein [Candidatus Deferrimicrobiaceae bacterium]
MGKLLLPALAFAAMLPAFPGPAQEGGEPPQIFLERKIYSHTSGGKRSFYEPYTLEKGDTLWKILERKAPLTPERYSQQLQEFRRVNPSVKDPSRLAAGQQVLIPSAAEGAADNGKTVAYAVKKGDTLTGILASRGVPAGERPRYLAAVQEVNPSVRDVNRIYAGRTLRIPTEGYFGEAEKAREEPDAAPALAAAVPPPAEETPAPEVPPAIPLTQDVASSAGEGGVAGKPGAELRKPTSPTPEAPVVETGRKGTVTSVATPSERFPYRGLLSDLFNALGEKWVERGTMYLPIPTGGEVVIRLEDFPVIRFSGGAEALLDFRGGLPQRVRDAITGTWPHVRVVSLSGAADAGEMIDRILKASGYHSFKEGLSRPVVIGEAVAVSIPARWVVQPTDQSLLSGDLVLVKEVPERPGEELLAVLRYARRVGIRVLPYAADPNTMEGFLVGLGEEGAAAPPVTLAVPPAGGLPAVDFGLSFLGIPVREGERLRLGGKGEGFQLVIQPERVFEAGGRKYVVDTGKMAPAIRAILKESGYSVFPAGKDDPGRAVFQRLLSAAGLAAAERKEYPIAGGGSAGYAIHVTGAFLSLPESDVGKARTVVLVRGKVHTATRALLRDLGVEIVEW